MNPSLINCCTIDWYDEWSREASLSVAQVYFANAEFIAEQGIDIKVSIIWHTIVYMYLCHQYKL